ncbi:uncharacterized protein KY384_008459 [Bacidia gigantensis]|uniref:uncharacterized protein n=1 Tax=Bacidia gigantensis TaxID=2732470 RepID=UPI001D04F88C|nr:uncharacterized protein KY384_008459 [Bacidia gigantensis]KAG8527030.1 hypothetical protein KY384_008459 [Bacidia gigantensis]
MKQYALIFGFREPYQVLVDAQMILDASRFAMNLPAALERTFSSKTKPMITQCSIRHLYALPPSHPSYPDKASLITAAKAMERRRCNHHTLEQPLSEDDCLKSVIDPKSAHTDKNLVNKFNYVVAVQDEGLRRWCRAVRGTPIVYVKRSVMVMEPMSDSSGGVKAGMEREKLRGGLRRKEVLGKRKREETGEGEGKSKTEEGEEQEKENEGEDTDLRKRKRKGPKGPNPLSMKKAKAKTESAKGIDHPVGDRVELAMKVNDEVVDGGRDTETET